ncbi:MAG: FAD-binding oxidoreductase [Promethearchaeota archaeon]
MALNGMEKLPEPHVGSLNCFINELLNRGFVKKAPPLSLPTSESSLDEKGSWLIVKNAILGYTLRDCSFLNISPAIICQPRNLSQLRDIVTVAHQERIPLTFAGGKTGLSGGFATPYVLVDLEFLQTLDKPVTYDTENHSIHVDQNVLVSYLIRYAEMIFESSQSSQSTESTQSTKSQGKQYMFPSQPASALKLPVRVGGLISTNASGIIAGKFGPIAVWIISLQIMTPTGEIRNVSKSHELSLMENVIGGMGYYGVILNAHIQLAPVPPSESLTHIILYGQDYHEVFAGLQEIQNQEIFPLNSEFIIGPEGIPGIFATVDTSIKVTWAILVKDTKSIVDKFSAIIHSSSSSNLSGSSGSSGSFGSVKSQFLSSAEYKEFMDERAALAIQTKSNDPDKEYIRFPGFEDLLMPPATLGPVFDHINRLIPTFGFPSIFVGYGHLNFRQGQGLLLHIRIPVDIAQYAVDPVGMQTKIARVTAEMNYILEQDYHIHPKAEHSTGMFYFWHHRTQIHPLLEKSFSVDVDSLNSVDKTDKMFLSPHLVIFLQICADFQIDPTQPWKEKQSKQVLERLMVVYLSGKWDIKQKIN